MGIEQKSLGEDEAFEMGSSINELGARLKLVASYDQVVLSRAH